MCIAQECLLDTDRDCMDLSGEIQLSICIKKLKSRGYMIIPSRLHAQTFNNQSKECISAY
jgi:hypothetical protein